MTPISLFVYGTLKDERILRTLVGKTFKRKQAVLKNYKKFAPRSGFPYILPATDHSVKGLLLMDVDKESLETIDKYEHEGSYYFRRKIKVSLSNGKVIDAYTYVGNVDSLSRIFGNKIHISIQKRVFHYLNEGIGSKVHHLLADSTGLKLSDADKKLLLHEIFGPEIHHLTNQYYSEEYLSAYSVKSEVEVMGIPHLGSMRDDVSIRPFIPNYLRFMIKHTIVNVMETKIREQQMNYLYNPAPLWQFTLTMLAALRLYNLHKDEIEDVILRSFEIHRFDQKDYIRYMYEAIDLACLLCENYHEEIKFIAMDIYQKKGKGVLPLGVELEFSNLGEYATQFDANVHDNTFCNMKYFYNFDLLRRTWKFGGHVDDHTFRFQKEKTDGGFLEYAFGKNCFFKQYSEPVTNDPWILHQLVIECVKFSDLKPHSLHLNIQCDYEIDWKKKNDPEMLICMLLLAGDFVFESDKVYRERRIGHKEIIDTQGKLHFFLQNRHSPYEGDSPADSTPVIEFQFPRLSLKKDYELITMALKGFILGYKPRPFYQREGIVVEDLTQKESQRLIEWAHHSTSLSNETIDRFLNFVEKGLMIEKKGQNAHNKRYIEKIMFRLERRLLTHNAMLSGPPILEQFKERRKKDRMSES